MSSSVLPLAVECKEPLQGPGLFTDLRLNRRATSIIFSLLLDDSHLIFFPTSLLSRGRAWGILALQTASTPFLFFFLPELVCSKCAYLFMQITPLEAGDWEGGWGWQ